jgi:hypothetical protein
MAKSLGIQNEIIMNKIYMIRGYKVMLDRDLAEMYGVETRRLNEQVKRNVDRFPIDFMFQLTQEELEILMSQNATKLPFVFTEHGVLMLSSVLNSARATQVNIQIMRVYTKLREIVLTNSEVLLKLEKLDKKIINLGHDVTMHDGEIESIFELINEIKEEKIKPKKVIVVEGFANKNLKGKGKK